MCLRVDRWRRTFLGGAAAAVGGLVLAFVGSDALSQEDVRTLTFTLCVRNYAGITEERLRRAEQEVATVYGRIEVDVIWIEESAQACTVSTPRSVIVILLAGEMWKRHTSALGLRPRLLGHAVRAAERTYLSWDQIDDLGRDISRDAGEILGLVIAHEVAHLLLPTDDHSSDGLMRADLGLFAPGVHPHFDRREAESIRAHLIGGEPER